MIYERNPVRCKFERRLEVRTSPLNIIYNPQAIKKVTEFFYKGRVHTSGQSLKLIWWVSDDILSWGKMHVTDLLGNQILMLFIYMNKTMCLAADQCKRVSYSGFGYQSELELRVAEAARRQYNKLKMQTKAEIRQTIDQLLVGEFIVSKLLWMCGLTWLVAESFLYKTGAFVFQENSKRWTMKLDISAPQVIFPDDFQSGDPMLVVIDLGRILLTNCQGKKQTSIIFLMN